jgi:putative transposase
MNMLDENNADISIRKQCSLMGIARSNIYYRHRPKKDDTSTANEIHEIWLSMPMYGYRKITKELERRGYEINHKKVRRLMCDMRIMAIYPRPKTSISNAQHKKYPYLLRELTIAFINQVWAVDITYIKLSTGFVYLISIIDVYSRFIIAWSISLTLEEGPCLETLAEALKTGYKPDILNTDQGVQFTSQKWIDMVENADIKVSMDGVGRWADNIYIERFWRTIKYECLLLHSLQSVKQVRTLTDEFIKFYNSKRLHQSLDYLTPAEVYLEHKIYGK